MPRVHSILSLGWHSRVPPRIKINRGGGSWDRGEVVLTWVMRGGVVTDMGVGLR